MTYDKFRRIFTTNVATFLLSFSTPLLAFPIATFPDDGTLLQSRTLIIKVDFHEGGQLHIHIAALLIKKLTLTLLSFPLGSKASLQLRPSLTLPITIVTFKIPGASLFIFINRHNHYLSFSMCGIPGSPGTPIQLSKFIYCASLNP